MKLAAGSRSGKRRFAQSRNLSASQALPHFNAHSSASSALGRSATSKIDNRQMWRRQTVCINNRHPFDRDGETFVFISSSRLKITIRLMISSKRHSMSQSSSGVLRGLGIEVEMVQLGWAVLSGKIFPIHIAASW